MKEFNKILLKSAVSLAKNLQGNHFKLNEK